MPKKKNPEIVFNFTYIDKLPPECQALENQVLDYLIDRAMAKLNNNITNNKEVVNVQNLSSI